MGEFEDLVAKVREEGLTEEAEGLAKFSGSKLRQELEETKAEASRAKELEAQVARLQAAPKKLEALREAGVDPSTLRKAEVKEIERMDFDEGDPVEWANKVVADLELETSEAGGTEGGSTQEPRAAAVVQAARSAPASVTGRQAPGIVKAEEILAMSLEKRMAWAQKNPDAWKEIGLGADEVHVG